MRLQSVLLWIFCFSSVLAVKEYLFKNCDNSGFCHRNKHYANQIKSLGSAFVPHYAIDPSSVHLQESGQDFHIAGTIIKKVPNIPDLQVELPITVSLLEGNNVRVQIDESGRNQITVKNKYVNHRRYNETGQWAFASEELPYISKKDVKLDISSDKLSFTYGPAQEYTAELQFLPVKLTISYKDEPQVVVNDQNFLNLEHWRVRDANAEHLSDEQVDFDMFTDSFGDSKEDKLPLGPESIGLDFTFKNYKNLYGIPEHADSLNLKDTTGSNQPYRLFNVDIFEYETDSRLPMYGAIPLLLAVRPELSVGLFWINSADTFVDLDKNSDSGDSRTHWISENGVIDFMIIVDKTPAAINKNYGLITGYVQLPPLFSLGYHQCRWNYNDEKDVLEINSLMDKHRIPYDTIWLDIEYTDSKKYFTWQNDVFPDPEGMMKELDATGRNLVVIIDPHIKTGYPVSDQFRKQKICINDATNTSYLGHCWPGESVWIDTLNPNAQALWDSQFVWDKKNKFTGGLSTNLHIWNDMNEPSVFNGPETTSPRDNLHYGGWEHRSVHNIYGLSYHEATYNSLKKRQSHTTRERPFILTRSYYSGSQRTAAMWTGDNMSKWEYLQISLPMVLTSNIVGMPFAGADVGGFFGNPSKELLTRWYQAGIWYPFFRAHAHIDSRRREPWVAGEPYTSIMTDAVKLRYSLLPMLYTAFYESSVSGIPIMKPVFYEALDNLESYSIEDQFFVGNSGLLVKPVVEKEADDIEIYLPDSEVYYDFTNGNITGDITKFQLNKPGYVKRAVTLNDIPVFLKGGSIIAQKNRYRRSSKLMANDPYTLIVAPDSNGNANGKLYIDDGESFGYTKGESIIIEFQFSKKLGLSAKVSSIDVNYVGSLSSIEIEKIVIISHPQSQISEVKLRQSSNSWNARFSTSRDKLIIHNPKLKVAADWSATFATDVEHDEL
ncbi:hypothetical protein G9P44_002885 [Scheffersomyces stipitis]|nr:hypothetical protein G9P44_002885 [Scheffersomyces stipitis]